MTEASRQRILFLSWKDIKNPASGGAEMVTDALATHLAQHNDVLYITSTFPGASPDEHVHGYRVIRKGSQLSSIFHAFFLFQRFHAQQPFTLIIDQVHGIPFFSVLYPHHPPIVTIAYEIAGKLWDTLLPHSIGNAIDAGWLFLYKRIPFCTSSPSTKKELMLHNIPDQNISIIPLFTDMTPQASVSKAEQPTLVILGRIAPNKRIEHAIESFYILKKTIPSLRLVIIGKQEKAYNEYFQEIERLCSQNEGIVLVQNADEQTKISWLNQAHIHIMPSKKEGYGIAILEAAMCSTPSIGYRVPGIQDAIIDGTTGILVDQQTPTDLALSIKNLLEHPHKLLQLQQQALEHARHFTKQQTVNAFTSTLQRSIRKNAHEAYIYNSLYKKIARSLMLDTLWIQSPYVPNKWQFLWNKYLLILFKQHYWDKASQSYRFTIGEKRLHLESPLDLGPLQSTFIDYDYLVPRIKKDGVIIDAGAHIGEFALVAEQLLHAKRIYSFEPISESFQRLKQNAKSTCYHAAICTEQTKKIHISTHTIMASGNPCPGATRHEVVQCISPDTLPELLAEPHIDLFKIDVEGMEYEVLQASKHILKKSRYIMMELSIDRPMSKKPLETLALLTSIIPTASLMYVGKMFGDNVRTDSVDMLFKNDSL